MNKLRFLLSLWVCKILIIVGKLAGKKGSATPGKYAYKICPDVLKILSSKVSGGIIAVCGTNGKTTTNNIIDKLLTEKGFNVVCNNIGANMLSGVITAFVEKASLFGRLKCDYATLEMDEAFAVKIFEHVKVDVMVITNLFRDQLDRYGEVELTAGFLKKALTLTDNTPLIVNADDPLLVKIGMDYGKYLTYGIGEKVNENEKITSQVQFCPVCGENLSYNYYHYSQLGDYYCEKCGFKHPKADFMAENINLSDGIEFDLKKEHIKVNYRGFYNVYNIMAAISVVKSLGIDIENISDVLSDYKPQVARMETFALKKPTILNLAKNPAGFNQAIDTVLFDKSKKDIIIAVNDCESDGMDISWIWDVDFEKLDCASVRNIGLVGMRKDEIAVRFKYSSVSKNVKVYEDLREAVCDMQESDSDCLYMLVNYTVIFEAQNLLKELEGKDK